MTLLKVACDDLDRAASAKSEGLARTIHMGAICSTHQRVSGQRRVVLAASSVVLVHHADPLSQVAAKRIVGRLRFIVEGYGARALAQHD